tara:strand:+ start:2080 stop:2421 length:342 start_codon:yes stop_codon:yes gene_type:complete
MSSFLTSLERTVGKKDSDLVELMLREWISRGDGPSLDTSMFIGLSLSDGVLTRVNDMNTLLDFETSNRQSHAVVGKMYDLIKEYITDITSIAHPNWIAGRLLACLKSIADAVY